MANDTSASETNRLCFLDTRHLEGPLVDHLDVWTRGGKRIGTFDGVVIDPAEHRARYLVVDRGRLFPDRCLIPLPAQLDVVHQALCVDDDDAEGEKWQEFKPARFRAFGYDDESTDLLTSNV